MDGSPTHQRLYTAIAVTADAGRRLHEHACDVRSRLTATRVVQPARMHVTLAFLGEVEVRDEHRVATMLATVAGDLPGPISCRSVGVSTYARGRVLGVDVDIEPRVELERARSTLLGALADVCPQRDERPWRPHVTILRSRRDLDLASLPAGSVDVAWQVDELQLVSSRPDGAARASRIVTSVPVARR